MIQHIFGTLFSIYLERKGRGKSVQEWMQALQSSGLTLSEGYTKVSDSEENRKILSHVIGIERWATRCMAVALGEPLLEGEYDEFRPARETGWSELQSQFVETREATVSTIEKIIDADVDTSTKINHNHMGNLTITGWLSYLDTHGPFESKRMK